MFKLAQKKKEEEEKKELAEKPGFAKQMSIRSKLLTQGKFSFVACLCLRIFSIRKYTEVAELQPELPSKCVPGDIEMFNGMCRNLFN